MRRKLKTYLSCIRYRDAIVLQAPALVGLAFSPGTMTTEKPIGLALHTLGSFLLMAHIFSFNDWSEVSLDRRDPNKAQNVFLANGTTDPEMLAISIILAMLGLFLFALISPRLLVIAVAIISLSVFYSFPILRFQGKRIPIVSSILHAVGTLLTFLLGYALFSEIDIRALLIGLYFGLIITCGHLVQEVQDYSGDRLNGISTHANRFGQRPMFVLAFALFTISFVYLYWLAHTGLIAAFLRYLVLFYPIYAAITWKTFKAGLDYQNVHRYRSRYRILFAFITLAIVIGVLACR
jgi:4-hydroxybenzoate polyprenyltransferase